MSSKIRAAGRLCVSERTGKSASIRQYEGRDQTYLETQAQSSVTLPQVRDGTSSSILGILTPTSHHQSLPSFRFSPSLALEKLTNLKSISPFFIINPNCWPGSTTPAKAFLP